MNKDFETANWIHFKGEGKLKQPTRATLDIIEKCDIIFNQFNKSSLRLCHDPLGKVVNVIMNKHPTFPPKIDRLKLSLSLV